MIPLFLWLQLKVLDGEKEQMGREVAELRRRVLLEEQREEERGKELFTLKQKLTEAETARDSLKKEVRMEENKKTIFGVFTVSRSLIVLLFNADFRDSKAACGVGVGVARLREKPDRSAAGGAGLREEAAG